MKILYVTTGDAPDAASVLADLLWLDPGFGVETVFGASGALERIRTSRGYGAVFVGPGVPPNEALALISSLRRDRVPVAIVAIAPENDRHFFAHAIGAGADDVIVTRGGRLEAIEDTVRRLRQNRHVAPEPGSTRLQVMYAGQDDVTWGLISEIPFVDVGRTWADEDGSVATAMPASPAGQSADVLVVDEVPGDVHPLQVVKWMSANASGTAVVVLSSPAAGDLSGAALELGADEVVSKSGSYRRRLVASLHRIFQRRSDQNARGATESGPPSEGAAQTAALKAAEERIEALSEAAQSATIALTSLRADHDQLRESQAFERALRDRDREALAAVTRELREEQERRLVLEHTLSQSEDQARAEVASLEQTHQAERRKLQEDLAKAADRLHQVAHNTQTLQHRLEAQLSERAAERDRLTDNALIGHAVFTREGRLVRCSDTFASMLGYASADHAVESNQSGEFLGTPDHAQLVRHIDRGIAVDRVESTLRRVDGRPVRVLTSAVVLPAAAGDDAASQIERLVIDLSGQAAAETQLQLARRLEAAGRLAAEMAPEIDAALVELESRDLSGLAEARDQVALLVRQLLAFSRQQAKPAGILSLNDAITRLEPFLRQIAGGAIDVRLELGEIEPVTAGEEDIEHLVVELVSAATGCLPFGGRLMLSTSSETNSSFVLRTSLAAIAAGYGVLPCATSPSLVRHAARCGGTLRVSGEAGRTSALHVHLPC